MGDVEIYTGDCLQVMKDFPDNHIDTVITDPPYGLSFMGKDWDHGIPGIRFWAEILRVSKPGAILLAFGGTRTFHRLTCAIEDAGWEIRDCLMWLYGSGFPKSLDISKAIDKTEGCNRSPVLVQTKSGNSIRRGQGEQGSTYGDSHGGFRDISLPSTDLAKKWDGWGTALKPAWEPIILAMKKIDGTYAENAKKHGVAGLNINGGRIGIKDDDNIYDKNPHTDGGIGSGGIYGRGKTTRYELPQGRFPANLILDEEAAAMLDEQSGESLSSGGRNSLGGLGKKGIYGKAKGAIAQNLGGLGDFGGASRFFYVAKASRSEREAGLSETKVSSGAEVTGRKPDSRGLDNPRSGMRRKGEVHNIHPTVKPIKLMEYLVRLTKTPTGGIVLDPFGGSGSTGIACVLNDRPFILIDKDPRYVKIAKARIEHWRKNRKEKQKELWT